MVLPALYNIDREEIFFVKETKEYRFLALQKTHGSLYK